MEVIGKSSSIIEFRCFQVEAEIVFRVLIWGLLFHLSPNLVFSKEGATLIVQECGARRPAPMRWAEAVMPAMATQHAEPSGEAGGQGCWWSGWQAGRPVARPAAREAGSFPPSLL